MKVLNVAWVAIAFFLSACTTQAVLPSNGTGETECLGDLLDGHIRVRAWGSGLNRPDAVQMAQKNAIRDILFSGLTRGKPGCGVAPLLPGPNARERHAIFFDDFFRDAGNYKKYTQVEKVTGFYKVAGGRQFVARVQLRIDKAELRKDMERIKNSR